MAAGDTVFGDHKALIAKVPLLLESTEKVVSKVLGMQGTSAGGKDLSADMSHPMVIAARFHDPHGIHRRASCSFLLQDGGKENEGGT